MPRGSGTGTLQKIEARQCINLRDKEVGDLYIWPIEIPTKDGRSIKAFKARHEHKCDEPWESVIGSDDAERYVRNWFRDLEAVNSL
jgi:hypothetical protein